MIRSMLGLTKHNRLRDQIRDTVGLYRQVQKHGALTQSADNLKQLIDIQTGQLLAITQQNKRSWNWGAAILAFLIACVFAVPAWFLYKSEQSWWEILLLVIVLLIMVVFLIAAFGVLFQRESGDK